MATCIYETDFNEFEMVENYMENEDCSDDVHQAVVPVWMQTMIQTKSSETIDLL